MSNTPEQTDLPEKELKPGDVIYLKPDNNYGHACLGKSCQWCARNKLSRPDWRIEFDTQSFRIGGDGWTIPHTKDEEERIKAFIERTLHSEKQRAYREVIQSIPNYLYETDGQPIGETLKSSLTDKFLKL